MDRKDIFYYALCVFFGITWAIAYSFTYVH